MPPRFEQYTTHRQSRRLDDWDYTQAAAYFVTICTRDRVCLFGEVETGRMGLNRYGRIAAEEWRRTANLRDSVALDAFIVMPNHVHGIIVIQTDGNGGPDVLRGDTARRVATATTTDGAGSSSDRQCGRPQAGSLGTIVGAYKSAVTRCINQHRSVSGESVWQRNYHDHIIRNDEEWRRIRQYIRTNPARWHCDRLYHSADP